MIDQATATSIEPLAPHPAAVRTQAFGLFGGFTLGVVARAWMRLISDNPEFTWSGTIFIVGGFTVFGLTQSIVAIVRHRTTRPWKVTGAGDARRLRHDRRREPVHLHRPALAGTARGQGDHRDRCRAAGRAGTRGDPC